MPIVLHRVDERLIHGQVVVGWGSQLRPDKYLVVDASLAESLWEQELYTLGVPNKVGVEFLGPEAARNAYAGWTESKLRSVLLTRDVTTMLELAQRGAMDGAVVNLGGIHPGEGREEALPYLFLDEGDRAALRELKKQGVKVSAQALPGSPRVSLEDLLE